MKVVFHEDFYRVYTGDPAAAAGRMEAVVETIQPHVEFVSAAPAVRQHIAAVHTTLHIQHVENQGLYNLAALENKVKGSGHAKYRIWNEQVQIPPSDIDLY
jgi:hypothetical protein